jgi:RHS repeat-associated protein
MGSIDPLLVLFIVGGGLMIYLQVAVPFASNSRTESNAPRLAKQQVGRLHQLRCVLALLISLFILGLVSGYAQDLSGLEQGMKPYGAYHGGDIDSISMVNGNLSLHIPLISYPQRGDKLHLGFSLVYNNPTFQPWATCNPVNKQCSTYGYNVEYRGSLNWTALAIVPDVPSINQPTVSSNYSVVEADGASHQLDYVNTYPDFWMSKDATGYRFEPNSSNPEAGTLWDRQGTIYNISGWQPASIQDTNGNSMTTTVNAAGNPVSWTDTLGRVIPLFSSGWATPTTSQGCKGLLPTVSAYLWSPPGPYGGTSQFTVCYAQFPISFTAPNCTGLCQPTSSTTTQIQSIVLPNGTAWIFEFDTTGALSSITLPTGGTISYTWTTSSGTCVGSYYTSPTGVPTDLYPYGRPVTSRTVNDQTGAHRWSYTVYPNTPTLGSMQTVVTDPANNDTVHTETQLGNAICSVYETEVDQYSGPYTGGNVLKKTATTYTYTADPFNSLTAMNVVPQTITTTDMPSGQVSQVWKGYDTTGVPIIGTGNGPTPSVIYGVLLSQNDYDFGYGSPGPLLRTTNNKYMAFSGPNASSYLASNVLTLPYTVQVNNGAGGQASLTQYNYDETALAASGLTSSNQFYASMGTYRGNNTSILRWLNSGTFMCPNGKSGGSGSYLISTMTYFNSGTLHTSADPCGNTTTYAYSMTYWGAYPTTITNALGQPTTKGYDFVTGLVTSVTDPNQLTTGYGYDSMWRLSGVTRPDGGQDIITRQESSYPFTATLQTSINSSLSRYQTNVFDGFGRLTQTQLTSDPQGTVYTDTTYDGLGRVHTVSNPYRGGADATSSPGITTYSYDPLSRKIGETYPDNSTLSTAYCFPSTLVTDPTRRWRRSRVNALGQLVEVDEPNAIGATVASSGCPGSNDPVWATAYTNDVLGNLTQVVQNGSRTRMFNFDSLSRMTSSSNPETSAISYSYNPDNTVGSRTDSRQSPVTTSYFYDPLHRVTGVSYSNGDPSLSFTYDGSSCLNLSACQNIGHRTGMTDAAGSESWAYQVDPGNSRSIHQELRINNSSPSNVIMAATYYLDLAGNVTQLVYPTGRTVNYTYDGADRPSTAADGSNGITYATGWQAPPSGTSCTPGAVCYTPQGSIYAMSIGQSCSSSGFNISESYNNRLQPNEITASSSAGAAMDVSYNFVDPVYGGNAGHVSSITNNLNPNRSQVFNYDQVNRIISAGTTIPDSNSCWGYQYSYDPWGNLLNQSGWTPNYNACTQTTLPSVGADGNNHLSAMTYDAVGNTLNDGNYNYTWNGENQMTTAAGVAYAYDGDGRRVSKGGGEFYWYGSGGEILAETDSGGNTLNEYVFFGGRRIAVLPASSNPLYYAQDLLGSSRVMVQVDGTLCYDGDFTPFGAELAYTSICSQSYKFEGKERDTETQNDDFGARYYSWRYGRWLSSDWSAVPVPVPYANLTNPQTLNLYSMVADDPESFADLDGHETGDRADVTNTTATNDNRLDGPPPGQQQGNGQTEQQLAAQQKKAKPKKETATAKGKTVTIKRADGSKEIRHGNHPFRDNNPGNLKTTKYGAIGQDKGFAIYSNEAAGWNALTQSLDNNYMGSSIADTFTHYAPASDNNDPVAYANQVGSTVGVPTTTKLSDLTPGQFSTFEHAIGQAEGFNEKGTVTIVPAP